MSNPASAQQEAFKVYWLELIEQCKKQCPEVIDVLLIARGITMQVFKQPVAEQRKAMVGSMNAGITLLSVADLTDLLWAQAVIFRWIWDWELAHPASGEASGEDGK